MKPFHTKIRVTVIGCLLLFTFGCWTPVTHKPPSCDLTPVLTIPAPEHIETLAACPRTETHVEGGINVHSGRRQPDNIKEMFDLRRGATKYWLFLFFDEAAAKRFCAVDKPFLVPVFREVTTNGCTGWLYYTEQPRVERGLAPLAGCYFSRASFRVRNALIHVETQHETPGTGELTTAVGDLAQMLRGALADTDQIPK